MAESTAGLPGSLYFVGFTGGLFTLGAIGIVVGPLIVAVFAEAVALLADEVNAHEVSSIPSPGDADGATAAGEPAAGRPEAPAATDSAGGGPSAPADPTAADPTVTADDPAPADPSDGAGR